MTGQPSLKALVGQNVGILARRIHPESPLFVARLHAVEPGGLWLESQSLTDIILNALAQQVFEATPVFFFPFEMIECVFSVLDTPSISETIAE